MTLLIVDDSSDSLALLRAYVEPLIQEIVVCSSGEEALDLLSKGLKPNLILLDLQMPGMNGLEVCRRLKESESWSIIPVLMITGSNDVRDVESAFKAGAADYVCKPVRELELKARAGALLRLKHESDIRQAREEELLRIKSELEKANATLKELSVSDGLTGLANRRAFNERLDLEWNRSLRSGTPLGLLICDVDHFKAYNDGLGHPAGDACLKRVAGGLASMVRPMDLASRIGGEEFALILPQADPQQVLQVGHRLCAAIESLNIPHPKEGWGYVTVSAGCASQQASQGHLPLELLKTADEALYRAKAAGRRRALA
ncbi:MAG: diguanylate cyclase [Planctomycetota bacterium]